MRQVILHSVPCPAVTYFSTLAYKSHDFRKKKKVIEHKMCVWIFSTTFIRNISHSTKNLARYHHKYVSVFMYIAYCYCRILMKFEFSRWTFTKKVQTSNFMKIQPVRG